MERSEWEWEGERLKRLKCSATKVGSIEGLGVRKLGKTQVFIILIYTLEYIIARSGKLPRLEP